MSTEIADSLKAVREAFKALIAKENKHSECDHKRASCKEVGCIGYEIKNAEKALTHLAAVEAWAEKTRAVVEAAKKWRKDKAIFADARKLAAAVDALTVEGR